MSEEKKIAAKDWNRRKFMSFGALGLFGVGVYDLWMP